MSSRWVYGADISILIWRLLHKLFVTPNWPFDDGGRADPMYSEMISISLLWDREVCTLTHVYVITLD